MEAGIPLLIRSKLKMGDFCPTDNVHKNVTKLSTDEPVIGIPFDADGHGRTQNASIHSITYQPSVHIIMHIDIFYTR